MRTFLEITPFAIVLLIILAIGELIVPKLRRQNIWLAVSLSAFAFVLLRAYLLFCDGMRTYPWLYESTLAANFWMGPLMYFFIRDAVGFETQLASRARYAVSGRMLIHFVPGLLVSMAVLPNLLFESGAQTVARYDQWRAYFDNTADWPQDPFAYLTPLALVHVAIYSGFIIWGLLLVWNFENLRRQSSLRAFLIMVVLAFLSTMATTIGFITHTRAFVEFAIALLALVAPLLYWFSRRYPDLFSELEELLQTEREKKQPYLQSQLVGVDLAQLEHRLADVMDQQRVYRRDDLNLSVLAELLQITPHRLSEYLNHVQNISFSDYINRRRVDAARGLLVERPDQTVLSIAYDVGFNSKSAFNKAFVRFTEQSPTEYRRRNTRTNL